MLSLFIMFSDDRKFQLDLTVHFLKKMRGYDRCQKILVVDGDTSHVVPGFEVVKVKRKNNEFCWADMWAAGVGASENEKVLYLDSDRLLPPGYLECTARDVRDDVFTFVSTHYMTVADLSVSECEDFLKCDMWEIAERYMGKVRYDIRNSVLRHGPGKNVMSGNTGFTKSTFYKLGGIDPWYRGHGAYADTDFHMAAHRAGCKFVDLGGVELHYHHKKLGESGVLSPASLAWLGLVNFNYYCRKWGLPFSLVREVAGESGITADRVRTLFEEYNR